MKTKNYIGNGIKSSSCHSLCISFKLDGVRVIVEDGVARSRNNKPLYNIPEGLGDGNYECYINSFKETISKVRSKNVRYKISLDNFYRLDYGYVDNRILISHKKFNSIDDKDIKLLLNEAIKKYEGIVISDNIFYYKVKKYITEDLKVLSLIEGKNANEGKLGAIVTELGKVGSGFTREQREEIWNNKDKYINSTIEVKAMEKTDYGKLRHPIFLRFRFDK